MKHFIYKTALLLGFMLPVAGFASAAPGESGAGSGEFSPGNAPVVRIAEAAPQELELKIEPPVATLYVYHWTHYLATAVVSGGKPPYKFDIIVDNRKLEINENGVIYNPESFFAAQIITSTVLVEDDNGESKEASFTLMVEYPPESEAAAPVDDLK